MSEQNGKERQTAKQRRSEIILQIRQRGFVSIDALARSLGVTVQTIRRDLNQLGAAGLVARYHGGAGLPSSVINAEYSQRQAISHDEKERIAALVARHIPPFSSLFINIGTTTEAVARALLRHQELRVITNNLNVAVLLGQQTAFKVIVTGGVVRNQDGGIIGQSANHMITEFRVDFGIIGISGIDSDGSLLDFDIDEVHASQMILQNAKKVFLVADHTKFGRRALVRMGSITQVSALFTDRPPPDSVRSLMASHGVDLKIVAG